MVGRLTDRRWCWIAPPLGRSLCQVAESARLAVVALAASLAGGASFAMLATTASGAALMEAGVSAGLAPASAVSALGADSDPRGADEFDLSRRVVVRLRPGVALIVDASGVWRVWSTDTPGHRAASLEAILNGAGLRGGSVTRIMPGLAIAPQQPALAHALGLDRDYILLASDPAVVGELLVALRACPAVVESAERDEAGVLHDGSSEYSMPNDALFPSQFALRNTGQSIQSVLGVSGADINALRAWDLFVPKRSVVVAVIDSGVAAHPDLANRLVPGWNVAYNNNQTGDEISSHGTHLAGIIAAVTNNGQGIAGLCSRAFIMPVKATNNFGTTGTAWVAAGIIWAADHGAQILNVSIGFDTGTQQLLSAVQYATSRGCIVVASAGNTPTAPIGAPGRYAEAIAVGATNNLGVLALFSATGPELDLVAPGQDVISTWHTTFEPNSYQFKSGTSQAAPHVAGVAAMVMCAVPNLSAEQVRAVLFTSARDLGTPGWDPIYGYGRLDAGRAMEVANWYLNPSGPHTGTCQADLNHDGRVTSDDFFLYVGYYTTKDSRADIASPFGVWNTDDFFKYMDWYQAGCHE